MIRQKWMYLLVGDAFLPGKPSLAMLPLGLFMVCSPFVDLLYGAPQPWSGLAGLFMIICMVLGLWDVFTCRDSSSHAG